MREPVFGVAVFDDDGGLQGEAHLVGGGMGDGAGAGNDDGVFGNDERLIVLAE